MPPWEKYQQQAAPAAQGPWTRYASPAAPAASPDLLEEAAVIAPPVYADGSVAPAETAQQPGWSDIALDIAGAFPRGVRRGAAMIAGAPVEAINAAPMLANLLPGEQGATPYSDRPRGGFQDIDDLLRVGGLVPDYEPQTRAGRVANRVGEEVGATAVPVGAAGMAAQRLGTQGARQLGPVARHFVEPMAVAPGRVASREMQYALAAGGGAQLANEMIDPNEGEGTWWSDLLGSLGGMSAYGLAGLGGSLARRGYGAWRNDPGAFDEIAKREVVDRIINNSSQMQEQANRVGARGLDTTQLADALSSPSAAEQVIPGFRANIADRTVDPGLSALTYSVDNMQPGASIARRNANAAAVDDRMAGLAPEGNATAFREAIGAGAQGRIDRAGEWRDAARLSYGDALADVTPSTSAIERGAMLRGALADRSRQELDGIANLYGQIDETVPVDLGEFNRRFQGVTENLPLNDRLRFSPSETTTAERLAPQQGPQATGLLDQAGNPIMREPGPQRGPVSEVMSMRSGLSSDMRAPGATSQQRRVTGQYLDETEEFMRSALPPEQVALMEQGRAARLDYGRRFEDRGAVPDIMRTTGRDQYSMPDERVAPRAMAGETDYRAVMAEAGQNEAARRAVREQIVADAQQANALRSPQALSRFMQERNFALEDFPEVRQSLENAGASKQFLDQAEAVAKRAERDYSPGGPSPAGQYLRYDDTRTRDAIKTAWNSPRPEESIRELLDVAGDTPQTRAAARAALWEEVKGAGQLSAPTSTSADGVQRWSGRALFDRFRDPKFARTAEVLFEDNPEHLADIRNVVDALARADGSTNARVPGASGTAQSLSGKLDPSMTTTGLASRARSVNRGQLSPTIAVVDVLSTYLRNRTARVQARAIDELMSQAMNDPDLAAALLRRYNPADEAAENRAFLSAFGQRIPTVANILAGADDDDDETFERAVGAQ